MVGGVLGALGAVVLNHVAQEAEHIVVCVIILLLRMAEVHVVEEDQSSSRATHKHAKV